MSSPIQQNVVITPEYTCGLAVKPKEGEKDLHEHMTLAYLGNKQTEFNNPLFCEKLPRTCTIAGETSLGPNKNIPVWLVTFSNEEYGNCEKFWKEFNVKQDHTGDTPIFHVTKKGETGHRNIGDKLTFTKFFAKRVGPVDPYYEVMF